MGDEPFILHPGEFALGSIYEVVTLPDDIAARVEGKSSLGRLGLLTHATAGFIDPGFSGHVTLELSNVATLPIKLWPGMKIGQLCFFRLSTGRASVRVGPVRLPLPRPARPDAEPLPPELPPHPDLAGRIVPHSRGTIPPSSSAVGRSNTDPPAVPTPRVWNLRSRTFLTVYIGCNLYRP